jgi:hypothetical protein
VLRRAEDFYAPLVEHIDALANQLTDSERSLVGRHLTLVAEVIERHARRLPREPGKAGVLTPVTRPGLRT